MPKKPVKSEEYRRLAAEAAALAETSSLQHVREKHETAAVQWAMLAASAEERRPNTAAVVSPGPSQDDELCAA